MLAAARRRNARAVRFFINATRGIDQPRVGDLPTRPPVAVLAPHPDDEALGCGGLIAKHRQRGESVSIIFLTSGERSLGARGDSRAARVREREDEAIAATRALGVGEDALHFVRAADGDAEAALDGVREVLIGLQPRAVCAPWPTDGHRDHRRTTTTLAALLPLVPTVERVVLYEVWSPLVANHLVDIADVIDIKVDAVRRYASAGRVAAYADGVAALARFRAVTAGPGVDAAEAYCVLERDEFLHLMSC